jgi:receptor protein-tyrosine kinase
MDRSAAILGTHWFHRRFTLTPEGRYVTTTEIAEWARAPYDQLRKNLLLHDGATGTGPRTILLTAARHGDGTTTTAVLLAANLASSHRCLLADLNFRWPRVGEALGLSSAPGVSGFLQAPERADLDQAIVPTRISNLYALPNALNGTARSMPDVRALRALVDALRARFDYIVIDAAPLLEYPDTALLAPLADVTLLVVAADSTPVEKCLAARRELERAHARTAGVVLTRQRNFVPERLARRLTANGHS